MKIQKAARLCVVLIRTFCLVGIGNAIEASAQLYWDVNGSGVGSGSGSTAVGTWGSGFNNWSTSSNGTSATVGWTSGQQAIFSAGTNATGTYTVTVSGNQTVSGLVFQEGNVTLSGGKLTLTTGVGAATVSVNGGWKATIGSEIAGTAGLIKSGDGMLVLSSSNSYSGVTDLRKGTLVLASDYGLGKSSLNLNGGTVEGSDFGAFCRAPVSLSANSTISGIGDLTFLGNFNQQGGSWTLTVNNAGQTIFSGSTFTLSDSKSKMLTLDVQGGDVTINSVIQDGAGTSGLIKNGAGRLVLTGNNTFSGGVQVNNGTLTVGSDTAVGSVLGALTLADGVTISGINGPHTIGNELVIGSTVRFGGTETLTFSDAFKLDGDHTFIVDNTTIFTGVITGGRSSLFKKGNGTLVLSGNNGFGVPPTVLSADAGTIAFGNDNGAGRPSNVLQLNGGAVQSWGGAHTLVNPVTIVNSSAVSGSYDLSFTGGVNNNGGSHTLTVNNTGVTTISGAAFSLNDGTSPVTMGLNVAGNSGGLTISSVVQNGTGTGALSKSGAGVLTLSGANTYTGGTTVNGGTVMARNTGGSATGSGTVTVNNGGTLAGNGTISGPIVLNNGGTMSPGVGVGTLNTAGETWNGGSILKLELNDANAGEGAGWDLLKLSGQLSVNASSNNPVIVDLHTLALNGSAGLMQDFTNTLSYSWRIATTSGGISLNPGETVNTDFTVQSGSFQNDIGNGRFSLTIDSGKDLVLNFTPGQAVPEPSAVAMTSLGFLLLFARFKTRSNPRRSTPKISQAAPCARVQSRNRSVSQPGYLGDIGLNAFISRC